MGSVPLNITGYVQLDSNQYADQANVYLMTFDTIGNGLTNIAETEVSDNGYYEFDLEEQENCVFYVQAELKESSVHYGDYLPTYHYSALNWMDATPIFRYMIYNGYTADILMIPAQSSNSAGNGTIQGTVANNEGRSMIPNVEILLYGNNGDPLIYDRTGNDGVFDFSDLMYGTYIVYTEMVGIHTTPAYVTLSQYEPTANLSIVVQNGEAVLGLDESQFAIIESLGAVYPNPSNGSVSLQVSMKQNANIHIAVTNNFGQLMMQKTMNMSAGKHQIKLGTDVLPNGLYFIKVRSEDGVSFVKKLFRY